MPFELEIITTDKKLFKGKASLVVLPADKGELGIEAGHCHMLVTLKIGEVRIFGDNDHLEQRIAVNEGFAQITPEKTLVVVASGETPEDIDIDRAESSLKRALERVKKAEEFDTARAETSLLRAKNRIKISDVHVKSE